MELRDKQIRTLKDTVGKTVVRAEHLGDTIGQSFDDGSYIIFAADVEQHMPPEVIVYEASDIGTEYNLGLISPEEYQKLLDEKDRMRQEVQKNIDLKLLEQLKAKYE